MTEKPDRKALALFRAHPMDATARELEIPEGATLAEIVDDLDLDRSTIRHLKIWIGDDEISWRLWHVVRPKAGVHIRVFCVPQGGDTLRMVALIAVAIAAAMVGD